MLQQAALVTLTGSTFFSLSCLIIKLPNSTSCFLCNCQQFSSVTFDRDHGAACCLSLCVGLLADKLIKSGWSVTRVRKTLQTVAFLGPALALIILSRSKDPRLAVACMTCALGITSLGKCMILPLLDALGDD